MTQEANVIYQSKEAGLPRFARNDGAWCTSLFVETRGCITSFILDKRIGLSLSMHGDEICTNHQVQKTYKSDGFMCLTLL